MFIPVVLFEIVLHYIPMFGIVMAFEDFSVSKGYFRSPWVGFGNFVEQFPVALRNTICIALLKGTIGFLAPVAFAVLLSLLRSNASFLHPAGQAGNKRYFLDDTGHQP